MPAKIKIAPQEEHAIITAYKSGMSCEELARQFERPASFYRRFLKSVGVKIRKTGSVKGNIRTGQEILDGIVEEYLAGKSALAAAATYGKSQDVCCDELKRRGIKIRCCYPKGRTPANKTPQKILDLMVEAYLAGHSMTKAAAQFGKSVIVCQAELDKRGIKPRGKRLPRNMQKRIVAAYRSGKSAREVASRFGVNVSTVFDELKRAGVPRNKRKNNGSAWLKFQQGEEWKAWRSKVLERDNFTCGQCGQRGGHLQAHHIFRKSVYPHLTLIVENGITLCVSCHRKISGVRREQKVAKEFLSKIGSTTHPLVWFDAWLDAVK